MNFWELRNFNWQAVASLLTVVVVIIALFTIISNKRKLNYLEKHLLGEFIFRISLIIARTNLILKNIAANKDDQTEFNIEEELPPLKERASALHDMFHEQGHLITDKRNYTLLKESLRRALMINEATTIKTSTLRLISRDLTAIIKKLIWEKE